MIVPSHIASKIAEDEILYHPRWPIEISLEDREKMLQRGEWVVETDGKITLTLKGEHLPPMISDLKFTWPGRCPHCGQSIR